MASLAQKQAEVLGDAFMEAGYSARSKPDDHGGYDLCVVYISTAKDVDVRHPSAKLLIDDESNIDILHDREGIARKVLLTLGLGKHIITDKPLPFKSLEIFGRIWWRDPRSGGGGYHTAEIIVDGKTVHKTPEMGGSGEMYVQHAREWLVRNGYVPKRYLTNALWQVRDDYGIKYSAHSIDVRRERDL